MTSRKEFLVAGAIATAFPAVAEAASPSPAATPPKITWPKFVFDQSSFAAALDGPQVHKHLFSSVDIADGIIFGMVFNTMLAYADLGVPASDVATAAVLYHSTAVLLGFDDHVWETYVIPLTKVTGLSPEDQRDVAQITAVLKPDTTGNPVKPRVAKLALSANLHVFLCNEATRGFATLIARNLHLVPLDVYTDLAAHLLPNAMLTPTGVWAVHAVQEHKYTFLPVTVV